MKRITIFAVAFIFGLALMTGLGIYEEKAVAAGKTTLARLLSVEASL